MVIEPRSYLIYQRPLGERNSTPEIVRECTLLAQAKREVAHMVEGKREAWIAKNGRSGRYYNDRLQTVMRVWLRRKRSYG